jgi:hypothetical protein
LVPCNIPFIGLDLVESVRTESVQNRRFPQQQWSKMRFRLIGIVCTAAKLQVCARGFSTLGKRDDVMELEPAMLATPAPGPDEGASATVAFPHFPFDCGWHMARAGFRIRNLPRSISSRELLLLEFCQQQRQGTIKDDGWIPIRHRVTQQILHTPQLVVRLASDRELHFVALRRKRRDDSGARRRLGHNSGCIGAGNCGFVRPVG